jgi:hypothetical protein
MKKQVILNFLNFPGIMGLGLMDGHSRPYFSGIDQSLNFQQKEALIQGIQQVVSTTPASFESFSFGFSHQEVHIHKLENGVILLVVTDTQLERPQFDEVIYQLKETLETDPHSAVSTFRLLAGSTTLNRPLASPSDAGRVATSTPPIQSASPATAPVVSAQSSVSWQECVSALDVLTDATAQYLGKIVVANTWRNTRPTNALPHLTSDRSGHFSFKPEASLKNTDPIDAEDYQMLQKWVQTFIQRCSLIIRDYPEMVLDQSLTDQQRTILHIERTR